MARGSALRGAIAARQKGRSQRQKQRQTNRAARQKERQTTKRLKIGAKERSGAYTPEARAQRGAAIRGVVGTIAGAASAIPGVPSQLGGALGALSSGLGSPVGTMGESEIQSWGGEMPTGGNGGAAVAMDAAVKPPIWKNPIVLVGAALVAFLLLRKK